jgi:hypothetical protein
VQLFKKRGADAGGQIEVQNFNPDRMEGPNIQLARRVHSVHPSSAPAIDSLLNAARHDFAGLRRAPQQPPGNPLRQPSKFKTSNEGVTGRRDWTRTNDPHHVKVVL